MAKILVVEDDRSLSDALVYNLRREDHTPLVAFDAASAVQLARQEGPDLVLLDLMLPGGSGFDVCQTLRSFTKAPIIMLTARGDDIDRVLGLEIGADDYVTKPFNLRELMARVKANLRRVELDERADTGRELHFGGLTVDVPGRQVTIEDRPIILQPKEFDLLVYLMRHPGTVLTRSHLLHAVWRHDFVGERTVDVHVRRVRSKLEKRGLAGVIRTVHGVGYAFDAEKQARSSLPETALH
jgi:DNA-binding response OmpR family regulator